MFLKGGFMEKTIKNKTSTLIIMLCWLVYTCSYIGKVNYAATINQTMDFFKINTDIAGIVSTGFFFSYGVGQIVNGILCKKYNLKYIIFISLTCSALANFIVGVTTNFTLIIVIWIINGFSMSILWPSLIRFLAENLSKKQMSKASVIMGTTVAIGTFTTYGLSAIFAKINFKVLFFIATTIFIVVAFIWLFSSSKLAEKIKSETEQEDETVSNETQNKKSFDSLLLLNIILLCAFGIVTNFIKDGLTTWMPVILKSEYSLDESLSIVLTLALPAVAVMGNLLAVTLNKKLKDFVLQAGLLFLVSGILISTVILTSEFKIFYVTLSAFTIVCLLVSSNNSLITCVFPLFMKGKVNSGAIAGILDGFCYVGSTLSAYGLGLINKMFGWNAVFYVLLGFCVFACVVMAIYLVIKKIITKKNLENLF